MRALVIAIVGLAIVLCLGRVSRELHGILYQMTLANCLAQADRGIVCAAAEGKSAPAREGVTAI